MNSIVEDILMHYGMPRRSGRYPYGSGENPYQHSGDFLSRVQELKKSGMSETDIAKNMGLTTTQLRTQMSLAKDERRALQVATVKGLREKGYSLNEIADKAYDFLLIIKGETVPEFFLEKFKLEHSKNRTISENFAIKF